MKKYWKLIAGVAAFVVFMILAGLAYKNLSAEYKPQQNLVTQEKGNVSQGVAENGSTAGTDNGSTLDTSNGSTAGTNSNNPADTDNGNTPDTSNGSTAGVDSGSTTDADSSGASGTGDSTASENQAPNFTVETADGEEVSLHDFFGKPIVLNFWASWCGPCKMELPDFQEAYEKYGEEIVFIMVNMTDGVQETKETAMKYMEDAGYTLPVYYDTKQDAAYTYTVYSLPTTFFINAEGEAVAYAQGMIDAQTLEKGISMIYP